MRIHQVSYRSNIRLREPHVGPDQLVQLGIGVCLHSKKSTWVGAQTAAEMSSTPTSLALPGRFGTGLTPPPNDTGELSGVCERCMDS